jgi:hypothetical protein
LARERGCSSASGTSARAARPSWTAALPSSTARSGSASESTCRACIGSALADRARHQECVRTRGLAERFLVGAARTALKSCLVFGFLLFGCAGRTRLAIAAICI